MQYLPLVVDHEQSQVVKMDDKSQNLANMKDVRAQDEQNLDCSQRNSQMTHHMVEISYHGHTKCQNVLLFQTNYTIKP